MGIRDIFTESSNETLTRNKELLEDHDLVNIFGSPNKLFLKFLNSKGIDIGEDEITEDLIEEFDESADSINLRLAKKNRQKEIIFRERKVWINLLDGSETIGTDLLLDFDGMTVEETSQKILYSKITDITVSEGSWSKNKMEITAGGDRLIFEINENKTEALTEIIEDNIENQDFDELDALLELYNLFDDGKISAEEFEARKAIIYSDDRYCTNCGAKLDPDSLFCPECGNQVLE